jgi:SEC-C motif-containing protein
MRSRFTAYVREDAAYLRRTWHPSTRPRSIPFEAADRWTGLEVLGQTGGSLFDAVGTVEFAAHYVTAGRPGIMRENSRFVREDGQWLYLGADP